MKLEIERPTLQESCSGSEYCGFCPSQKKNANVVENHTHKYPQRTSNVAFYLSSYPLSGGHRRMCDLLGSKEIAFASCRVNGTMKFFIHPRASSVKAAWPWFMLSSNSSSMGINSKKVKMSVKIALEAKNATLENAFKFQMADHSFLCYSTQHSRISKQVFSAHDFPKPVITTKPWSHSMVQLFLDLQHSS